jgi:transcriptional regulator with XRE-family HTH domain
MAIDLKDYLATLPEARRQAIEARAEELIAEELSLAELRRDLKQSQVDLAKKMGVKQGDVSKLERRSDMHVSTLRRYVEAAGGSLVIVVKVPGKVTRRLTFNAHRTTKGRPAAKAASAKAASKKAKVATKKKSPTKGKVAATASPARTRAK